MTGPPPPRRLRIYFDHELKSRIRDLEDGVREVNRSFSVRKAESTSSDHKNGFLMLFKTMREAVVPDEVP